ncbi:uncharacterized protein LOC128985335 [Macrosteles quadrilineatus]|uniref:uncharacterized protein LOC128985335 n=1 Tax=Macrosteles quadrilineatus TaxID=74068 RepID=UPI0023E2060A|nr:uncharacterized protein LOC128985335 [Macrosteles quadrilineatus]
MGKQALKNGKSFKRQEAHTGASMARSANLKSFLKSSTVTSATDDQSSIKPTSRVEEFATMLPGPSSSGSSRTILDAPSTSTATVAIETNYDVGLDTVLKSSAIQKGTIPYQQR